MLACLEGCAGVWKRRVTLARKRGYQSNRASTDLGWTKRQFNPTHFAPAEALKGQGRGRLGRRRSMERGDASTDHSLRRSLRFQTVRKNKTRKRSRRRFARHFRPNQSLPDHPRVKRLCAPVSARAYAPVWPPGRERASARSNWPRLAVPRPWVPRPWVRGQRGLGLDARGGLRFGVRRDLGFNARGDLCRGLGRRPSRRPWPGPWRRLSRPASPRPSRPSRPS